MCADTRILGLREDAVLQTLSDSLASFLLAVLAVSGISLILLPFAMVLSIVLHGLF
jgi:hypothetical protein